MIQKKKFGEVQKSMLGMKKSERGGIKCVITGHCEHEQTIPLTHIQKKGNKTLQKSGHTDTDLQYNAQAQLKRVSQLIKGFHVKSKKKNGT